MSWTEDKWLGAILDIPTYTLADEPDFYDHLPEIPVSGPVLLTAKVDSGNFRLIHCLENSGFILVDTNIQLSLESCPGSEMGYTREATPDDEKSIRKIASNSFSLNRFHNDPEIAEESAKRIKEEWAANFFKGQRGDMMLVTERMDEIGGFLLALNAPEKVVIDLIAVRQKHRKTGCGREMINFLWEQFCRNEKKLIVGTQITNRPSLELYHSLGFRHFSSSYVFHKHIRAT